MQDGDGRGGGEAGCAQQLDEFGGVCGVEALAVGFVEALTDQCRQFVACVVAARGERGDGGVEPGRVCDGECPYGSVAGELGGVACFVEGAGEREPFHVAGGTVVDGGHPSAPGAGNHVEGDLIAEMA